MRSSRAITPKLLVLAGLFLAGANAVDAQQSNGLNTPLPKVSDTAKQPASEVLDTKGVPGATDAAPEASPVSPQSRVGAFRPGTMLMLKLNDAVSSGAARNGDSFQGTLATAAKTSGGTSLRIGTKIEGTVVSAAKAGSLISGGVLSLQLTRVGGVPVITDVVEFNGAEGHKDVADAAPAKGTEALATAGSVLTFHVLENANAPGVIPGATLPKGEGGANGASGVAGAGENDGSQAKSPAGQTGTPNLGPGVNQTPVNGAARPPSSPRR